MSRTLWIATLACSVCFASAPDYSKESYVIEHFGKDLTFASDGTWTGEQSAAVRVQSDAGVREFGVLSFSYNNATQDLKIDYVRVKKADGSVVITPESNAHDISAEISRAAPMYSDLREKQLPIKSLSAGDVLEYRVKLIQKTPEIAGQFWYSQSFLAGAVVLDETLRVSVPAGKYVKVVSPNAAPEVQEEQGRKVYLWKSAQLEPTKQDSDKKKSHSSAPPAPAVQLTTFKNWDEVGQWYAGLQNGRVSVTPPIQAKADELTRGLTANTDKARAIYAFVSTKFRYISVSLGTGRYQPHAAADVLVNQYGDCKDKHTLLASLLKAAGIEAWPALMGAGLKIDADVPSPAQLNHVITVLPQGSEYVWLDTTPEVAPYGLLQESLLDERALVIPSQGPARLMTTPAAAPFPKSERVDAKGVLKADGTLTAHFDFTTRGTDEIMMRSAFHQTSPAQWRELVQNIVRSLGFPGDVTSIDVDNPEDLDKPFHIAYDYTRSGYSDWANLRITPPVFPILFAFGEESPKPDEPISMGGLGELKYTATLQLPAGFSAEIPESRKIQSDFAEYSSGYSIANGVLVASRGMIIRKAKVPVGAWDDYLSFQKKVTNEENQFMQLSASNGAAKTVVVQNNPEAETLVQQAYQSIQSRDFNTARDQLKQASRINSKQRGLWATYASLHMMNNDPQTAMEAFRKELKNYPDSVATYRAFASAQLFYGYKTEAGDTLRSLLKLAPGDVEGVLQLSSLLIAEKNYANVPGLVEKALVTSPDDQRLQGVLAEALMRMGRKEEGVPALQKSTKGSTDSEVLNNAAYLLGDTNTNLPLAFEYAEKAVEIKEEQLKKLELSTVTNEDLRNVTSLAAVWDTLGWVYFQSGDLDRAEKYVDAAWRLSQHGIIGDHLGQIYARQGQKEPAIHIWQLALSADRGLEETKERLVKIGGALVPDRPALTPAGKFLRQFTSPAEELGRLRTIKVPELRVKEGSAEFFVLFSQYKPLEVQFISGPDSLRIAGDALAKASFNFSFPDEGPEKIVRRGILSCSAYTKPNCQFTLLLPASTRR